MRWTLCYPFENNRFCSFISTNMLKALLKKTKMFRCQHSTTRLSRGRYYSLIRGNTILRFLHSKEGTSLTLDSYLSYTTFIVGMGFSRDGSTLTKYWLHNLEYFEGDHAEFVPTRLPKHGHICL